jgi:GDP-D-mannose 3', 5'-epimerase
MNKQIKVLVTGAGGFLGHHLVSYLKERGYWVRGVDIVNPEYENSKADDFKLLDLRRWENCLEAAKGMDEIYNLAANMGGIGFIESNKAIIVHDNTLINMHMIEAARVHNVPKFLYTSSACIYPGYKQKETDIEPLKEVDAYPADAEDGYGWEKLYAERTCKHYMEDYGIKTYSVRFHNIFGPLGTYDGGREKSPAAICRKVALAKKTDSIEVWGDGKQTRSYCFSSDCIEGIFKLMQSNYHAPINLGQDRMLSINNLVDIISTISGKTISKDYDITKPQGVRGRNSNNTIIEKELNWKPKVSLEEGLELTYKWIWDQLHDNGRNPI